MSPRHGRSYTHDVLPTWLPKHDLNRDHACGRGQFTRPWVYTENPRHLRSAESWHRVFKISWEWITCWGGAAVGVKSPIPCVLLWSSEWQMGSSRGWLTCWPQVRGCQTQGYSQLMRSAPSHWQHVLWHVTIWAEVSALCTFSLVNILSTCFPPRPRGMLPILGLWGVKFRTPGLVAVSWF